MKDQKGFVVHVKDGRKVTDKISKNFSKINLWNTSRKKSPHKENIELEVRSFFRNDEKNKYKLLEITKIPSEFQTILTTRQQAKKTEKDLLCGRPSFTDYLLKNYSVILNNWVFREVLLVPTGRQMSLTSNTVGY